MPHGSLLVSVVTWFPPRETPPFVSPLAPPFATSAGPRGHPADVRDQGGPRGRPPLALSERLRLVPAAIRDAAKRRADAVHLIRFTNPRTRVGGAGENCGNGTIQMEPLDIVGTLRYE